MAGFSGPAHSHFQKISELRLKSCMERNFSVRGLRETTASLILLPDHMIVRLAYMREDGTGPSFFFDPFDKILGCITPRNIDFRTKL
jgi:hypothetical protein